MDQKPVLFGVGILFLMVSVSGASQESSYPVRAAILHPGNLPIRGTPSTPTTLAKILRGAGYEVRILTADSLADPREFNTTRYDLVVVPTGETFPGDARETLVRFLQNGGNLMAMGGYAFNYPVRRVDQKWISERDWFGAQLEIARRKERSLLPNGNFEAGPEIVPEGFTRDGQWHGTQIGCRIVKETPQEGGRAARAFLEQKALGQGGHYWLDWPAKPGTTYQVSGWMRTQEVAGPGMAFLAMYQFDAQGKLVEFRDFAKARGTTPWQQSQFTFTPRPNVARLHISGGLFQAWGTAWLDDIRLADVTGLQWRPMNTSSGTPRDGLVVAPDQLGLFDASFPLQRTRGLRTAPGQYIVREPVEVNRDLAGWAASGVVGYNQARWLPVLDSCDRFGRPRGAAGALLLHYQGPFAGSAWAYFGVSNLDLFQSAESPLGRALQQIAQFMARKTFLHSLETGQRLYRPHESASVSVIVDNRGRRPFAGTVRFHLGPAAVVVDRPATVAPGASQRLEAIFPRIPPGTDLCEVRATLLPGNEPIDTMASGFVVEQATVVQAGPRLRFADNYFTINGRPLFLFGSDSYGEVYAAACENPLTWSADLAAARDVGMNLYEILQPSRPGHVMTEHDWRSFAGLGQLTQKHRLVFMPGMLIGHNVAVGDAELAEESRLCGEYARRLGSLPGLLWYINGDYALDTGRNPKAVRELWNRWLKSEYASPQKLQEAWSTSLPPGKWGEMDFPPPASGSWHDPPAVERMRFHNWLTTRWNQAHVQAVREHDRQHPITSEYYSFPMNGLDLVQTIADQDVANVGFFDLPQADVDHLPWRLLLNDLRARGKGVSLGEYGVKTHPAWSKENGAEDYHLVRTEEEQKRLFLAVAHYGLGLGACKVQNWCLRDDPTHVFPWGIFHPNQLIPKDIAYTHRNLSILWRFFQPVYRPKALAVCLANSLRLGNEEGLGPAVAYRTFADLLALHYPFQVIDDDHVDSLSRATRTMIYPAPLALGDEAYAKVRNWVREGGTLLLTGDFSHDRHRCRTRLGRLTELAGVEFAEALYPPPARNLGREVAAQFTLKGLETQKIQPCLRIRARDCEVLGRAGEEPVLVRKRLGRGTVYYFTDPIELSDQPGAVQVRRQLYAAFLRVASGQLPDGPAPLEITPNEPWLHLLTQPTAKGSVHVVYNTKRAEGMAAVRFPTAAGGLEVITRNGWPALAAVTRAGEVAAVVTSGKARVEETKLMEGQGLKGYLSLDGADLRKSQAILAAPFEPGRLTWPEHLRGGRALVGEFRRGTWTTLERISGPDNNGNLEIEADRATCLILLCAPGTEERWTAKLTEVMQFPEKISGF